MRHHGGAAAEAQVARHYAARGHRILGRRWRGRGGEIDLIAGCGGETVFVEVKRAATHAAAARRLSDRQVRRLLAGASEYMADRPDGLLSPVRFDVALVDGHGRIEILENALQA